MNSGCTVLYNIHLLRKSPIQSINYGFSNNVIKSRKILRTFFLFIRFSEMTKRRKSYKHPYLFIDLTFNVNLEFVEMRVLNENKNCIEMCCRRNVV